MDRAERPASVILILFGLFIAYYSREYLKLGIMISPGAGFLPYYIGVILSILGLIWLFQTFFTRNASVRAEKEGDRAHPAEGDKSRRQLILYRFLPGVLLVLLYAWLFEKTGYILSTVIFMVGWQKVVEREGWLKTGIIALVCAGAMHTLFAYLLKVSLPAGSWFS